MSVTFYIATGSGFETELLDSEFELNVSNSNAYHLLGVLGVEIEDGDLSGSEPAEQFLGRVLVGLALNPTDEGTATVSDVMPGGAVFVQCGRHAGYTDERLEQLRDLAQDAVTRGARVVWN